MGLRDWLNQSKRIDELETVVTKLNSRMDECELDWVEMRARCKRLLDRTEKAARRVDQGVDSGEPLPTANDGETPVASPMAHNGRLSDHQRQIQQQILRRRAGM
jgi:outer membrane murein-binding lipoprotein Lpp